MQIQLEGHSIERITLDKGRYPTAHYVFCCAWPWP